MKIGYPNLPIFGIFAAGGIGTLGQILMLREFMVLFYGNELSSGLIFCVWMLWTAAGSAAGVRFARCISHNPISLLFILSLLILILPASIICIRASGMIWQIPTGEILSPLKMLAISLTIPAPFCMLSGFLFPTAWAMYAKTFGQNNAVSVYAAEASGAAIGGLVFYFVLLPNVFGPVSEMEMMTQRWRWGKNLIAVSHTPYQHLALTKQSEQYSLFSDGLWAFSFPDPQSSEIAVHPVMLQHPKPESVLLIGGCGFGLADEILKYKDVRKLDCVEPDPGLTDFLQRHLPRSATAYADSPKLRLIHDDAISFIRQSDSSYDVILMNVGNPINTRINRFYTIEFFDKVKMRLNSGGIFSFSVSSASGALGSVQIRFLQSIHITLSHVFPNIRMLPGDQAGFFASDHQNLSLIKDPDELIRRMSDKNIECRYLKEFYWYDLLHPMALEHVERLMSENTSESLLNKSFSPTTYFYGIVLKSGEIRTGFKNVFLKLSEIRQNWLRIGILVCILLALLFIKTLSHAVNLCVMISGGTLITEQIVLLSAFQILAGSVYTKLAIIIAFFMIGLAGGVKSATCKVQRVKRFLRIQTICAVYPIVLLGIFAVLAKIELSSDKLSVIFAFLALIAGFLGGRHFSIAAQVLSEDERAGGKLYAADIIGAAVGSLLSSFFLLPIFGFFVTLTVFAVWMLGGGICLRSIR